MPVKLLDVSTLKRELVVLAPFKVFVPYTPRPTLVSLMQSTRDLSVEDRARAYAKQCIGGWQDLTPAIARALNVPFHDDMAAADGKIPFDEDAATALWMYAYADKVEAPITDFSWHLLETIEKEKVASKNDLSGSSPQKSIL